MNEVADNPMCDLGTGLMMYWLIKPDFYLQFENIDAAMTKNLEYGECYKLLKKLEEKILSKNFELARISFDPSEEHLNSYENSRYISTAKWYVPDALKKQSPGTSFPFDMYDDQSYVWGEE